MPEHVHVARLTVFQACPSRERSSNSFFREGVILLCGFIGKALEDHCWIWLCIICKHADAAEEAEGSHAMYKCWRVNMRDPLTVCTGFCLINNARRILQVEA